MAKSGSTISKPNVGTSELKHPVFPVVIVLRLNADHPSAHRAPYIKIVVLQKREIHEKEDGSNSRTANSETTKSKKERRANKGGNPARMWACRSVDQPGKWGWQARKNMGQGEGLVGAHTREHGGGRRLAEGVG